MTPRIRTLAEAPALESVMHRLHGSAWPPFLRDDALSALWPRLYAEFPKHAARHPDPRVTPAEDA